jgi:16S rRNA (cytidine1402-2'-O)-methyltransferase
MSAAVYMIPAVLHEEGLNAIPSYILDAIKKCQVFFVENERTTRRYFKQLDKSIVIDDFEWHTVPDGKNGTEKIFRQKLNEGKVVGIVSEAGCPGIADPGQSLAAIAQQMQIPVRPLVGPSSILLALMASGMNGQQFRFVGYLPIDTQQRTKAIQELEADSAKKNCTEIFIETPYRNNQLFETLTRTCNKATRLCVAVDISGPGESIVTKTIADWSKTKPELHKRPAIFLLYTGKD